MPYKDKEKQRQATVEFHKQMYQRIVIQVRKDDDETNFALFKMQEKEAMPLATYATKALREKLIADGYLKEQ